MLVKFNSHRARDKAFRVIPQRIGLWSLRRSTGKGVYRVSAEEFIAIATIKGVSRFSDGPDLMNCWPTSLDRKAGSTS